MKTTDLTSWAKVLSARTPSRLYATSKILLMITSALITYVCHARKQTVSRIVATITNRLAIIQPSLSSKLPFIPADIGQLETEKLYQKFWLTCRWCVLILTFTKKEGFVLWRRIGIVSLLLWFQRIAKLNISSTFKLNLPFLYTVQQLIMDSIHAIFLIVMLCYTSSNWNSLPEKLKSLNVPLYPGSKPTSQK